MKQGNQEIEPYRIRDGRMGSDSSFGNNGLFWVRRGQITLQIIASDGMGWDHVSVVPVNARTYRPIYRVATWEEMAFVKHLFFEDAECAVEYHPPKSDHISAHNYCLHLWRSQDQEMPMPPKEMVA